MTASKEKATEELILDAAMKIFTRRGFAGARMEEIAKEAGINRALLHYYYRDKETMFNIIFETRFKEFFSGLMQIFGMKATIHEKLKAMIAHEIDTLMKHPDLPRFVINEIVQQPERLFQEGQKMGINPRQLIEKFETQVKQAVDNGEILPISGRQLLMNTMSLCIYPFVAKPIVKALLQLDENSYSHEMELRKEEVYEFLMRAITP